MSERLIRQILPRKSQLLCDRVFKIKFYILLYITYKQNHYKCTSFLLALSWSRNGAIIRQGGGLILELAVVFASSLAGKPCPVQTIGYALIFCKISYSNRKYTMQKSISNLTRCLALLPGVLQVVPACLKDVIAAICHIHG